MLQMPSRRQPCAVRGCRQYKEKMNNQSNANTKPLYDFQPNNISFHRFPTNQEIRKRWIENLDVDGSLGLASKKVEHMVVCSLHFTELCNKKHFHLLSERCCLQTNLLCLRSILYRQHHSISPHSLQRTPNKYQLLNV